MRTLARWLPAVALALVGALALAVAMLVDLTPSVDERFFFSSDSAAFRESQEIAQQFSNRQLLVVTAHAPDIAAPVYGRRIGHLTRKLERLERVRSVTSLAAGPKDLEDARASPLWRRLLLLQDVPASNLVLTVDDRDPHALIDSVQRVLRAAERPDFRLTLAGVPYVVDAIARNLKRDFRTFSLIAVAVFGALVLVLFRSWAVLLGSLTACAIAALGTLLAQHLLGGRIGLLTANLVTIAFVLTQSHVVFMTNNWRQLRARHANAYDTTVSALSHTVKASAWCMLAALLGFGSLLAVEAQPLRELGRGGTIATLCALASAYLAYPAFLLWARPPPLPQTAAADRPRLVAIPPQPVAAAVLLLALAIGGGAMFVNSDPSLLDYFARGSDVRTSLEQIDPHGGSSPLNLAVRRTDGARLDSDDSYDRMWDLQRALQEDPDVGTVVSLPVLMAEAERSPVAALLPWNWLLDLLSRPTFDRVAQGFVTKDRTQALYVLRMTESGRGERRTQVIARLKQTVARHGFTTVAVGGIYALQGQLADLVMRSLVEGLAGLLAAVAVIAFAITRSFTAALAMLACTATVPTVALGTFGIAGIPLDVIATPGVNVAIGVAVDSMIHLGTAWRRARASRPAHLALAEAQREQAGGIVAFSAVVLAGFAIFAASSFPPTQRFGLSVILGAATAGAMALWILPGLLQGIGGRPRRPRSRLRGERAEA